MRALASLAFHRRRTIVVLAVLLAVAAAAFGGTVAERLDPYGADDPATESQRAEAKLAGAGVRAGADVVAVIRGDPARVQAVTATLREDPAVGAVTPPVPSNDGRAAFVAATFEAGTDDAGAKDAAERLRDRFAGERDVTLGGPEIGALESNEQVQEDLARAELFAFPILLVLSFLFFRGLVAALLPLIVGGLSIVLTFAALRAGAELGSISVFAINLVTGLGLGLGIDSSLFIVSRYREEIARDGPGLPALQRTLATAGRTVLFSCLTVAIALAALLVFPQRFLYSMGIGGVIVTLVACAVALTVLPAVLALLGPRVNALAPRWMQRGEERQAAGGWYRLSRAVGRRPATIAIATAATLVALALPLGGLDVTAVDASVLPQDRSARQVHEALENDFPPHQTTPVSLVLETGSRAEAESFLERVRALPGTGAVSPVRPVGDDALLVDVVARDAPYSDAGQAFVREVRDLEAPFGVQVGGQASAFHDLLDSLASHAPAALLILLGATTVLLFLFTGSVLIPLVSLVMNGLALGATFGVLTWIFSDGRLEGLLGYTSQGALETTMPLVILAMAFGLSTDYGVFLLSRIKEARDGGATDGEAVAIGLERVGRIATAAALLFCVAVGAFVTSEMVFIKQLGLGTALAVIIDATIVRALLVPSLLALLGRHAWWAPRPLRRLHERLGLGHEEQPQPAQA